MPRQRKVDPEQLKTLEQRVAKAQRDLRYARSLEKKQARADDARRKIIAGALALEHLEKNPGSEFGKTMLRLLDEYTRPHERQLFEFLPVREESAPPPSTAETEPPTPSEAAA
ncbi:MAG: mobilization protein [Rhizobiaceae bacterium]